MTPARPLFAPEHDAAMRRLRAAPGAWRGYDPIVGAMAWSDESTAALVLDQTAKSVLGALWAARTAMIAGEPVEPPHQRIWDRARRLYPEWPGFLAERRDASHRAFLDERRRNAGDEVLAMFEQLFESLRPPSHGEPPGAP